jgi:hypothetical protein
MGWTNIAAGETRSNPSEANTSDAARRDAIHSIPLDKLDRDARAKVESVIANTSIYRRMPVGIVACEPSLFIFLVRHPDVVVNIWEAMEISRLQLRQTEPQRFRLVEEGGTAANVEILYSSRDTHLIYGEGVYHGPLFARAVRGRGILLMKTGFIREADGRCLVTSQLDSFVCIEPGAAELLTKTIQPIIGRTADNNFLQTVNFAGSVSHTIDLNNRGVQRLAGRLEHVTPEVRTQFAKLAADLGKKGSAKPAEEHSARAEATPSHRE